MFDVLSNHLNKWLDLVMNMDKYISVKSNVYIYMLCTNHHMKNYDNITKWEIIKKLLK